MEPDKFRDVFIQFPNLTRYVLDENRNSDVLRQILESEIHPKFLAWRCERQQTESRNIYKVALVRYIKKEEKCSSVVIIISFFEIRLLFHRIIRLWYS